MSVNTLVKDGILHEIPALTKILELDTSVGAVHYNPGLCRDPEGTIYISIRSCVTNLERFKDLQHPNHYRNYLHVGILEEKTLTVKGLIEVKPEEDYEGFQWGIEDIRLFWREDGLHGIGVSIPVENGGYKLRQAEILIDYEKGTYKLIKDHGRPFGHAEKNWSPPQDPTDAFDFIYSSTQIVKDDQVIGEPNDLFIHNGTQLIPYRDGYVSIGHAVCAVHGERTYAQMAMMWDSKGTLIKHSQFFHFNVGWREALKETIEFASGLIWADGEEGEEMLVGIGVKDEVAGICRLPMSDLKWEDYADATWYAWRWGTPPNRIEIPTPHIND